MPYRDGRSALESRRDELRREVDEMAARAEALRAATQEKEAAERELAAIEARLAHLDTRRASRLDDLRVASRCLASWDAMVAARRSGRRGGECRREARDLPPPGHARAMTRGGCAAVGARTSGPEYPPRGTRRPAAPRARDVERARRADLVLASLHAPRPRDPHGRASPRMTASAGAVVRVAMGPRVGERRFIAPGARLTVGRAERADFAFPQDPAMSGLHAELAWDGPTLVLRDRESLGGTTLGGERVPPGTAVPVPDGAWVSVGSTSLLVRHEVTAPGPARLPAALEAQLLAALTPHVGSLFAVLDGAQGDAIHEALDTHRDEARSLYEGPKGEALARVAPHLVRLDAGSSLLHHVVRQGHGLAWGIFLRCRRPFAEVRRRLRRYLVVTEDSTSRRMYFRYYDPRVAREILPILTLRQEDEFFGDEVEEVFAEGEDGSLLAFSRGQRHGRVVVPASGASLEDTHAHP